MLQKPSKYEAGPPPTIGVPYHWGGGNVGVRDRAIISICSDITQIFIASTTIYGKSLSIVVHGNLSLPVYHISWFTKFTMFLSEGYVHHEKYRQLTTIFCFIEHIWMMDTWMWKQFSLSLSLSFCVFLLESQALAPQCVDLWIGFKLAFGRPRASLALSSEFLPSRSPVSHVWTYKIQAISARCTRFYMGIHTSTASFKMQTPSSFVRKITTVELAVIVPPIQFHQKSTKHILNIQ